MHGNRVTTRDNPLICEGPSCKILPNNVEFNVPLVRPFVLGGLLRIRGGVGVLADAPVPERREGLAVRFSLFCSHCHD